MRWLIIACLPLGVAAQTLPDPTRPYNYNVAPVIVQEADLPREQMSWQLSGIRISPEDRSALLNGQLVRVGDSIDGAEVVEIDPDSILIEYNKNRIRVNFLAMDIKQENDKTIDKTTADNS